jgi:hypothetical protein
LRRSAHLTPAVKSEAIMKGIIAVALVCVSLAPASISAQFTVNALSIPAGTHARIRTTESSRYVDLTVLNVDHDSLRYHLRHDDAPKSLAWDRVTQMDVSAGTQRHFFRDTFIGLFGGTAIGALLGNATAGSTYEERGLATLGGAIAGAGAGALAGAVIGVASRTERWAPVALTR